MQHPSTREGTAHVLPGPLGAFDVLRNRDFRLLWFGANGSVLGSTMLQLARGYIAYDLTGSAAALGFVTLAQGVPMLILALVGGVVADRVKKRPLLLCTQGSLAVIGLISAILYHSGAIAIWQLAVLSLAQGAVFAFNQPSRQAFMIELVGPNQVAGAVALNNASGTCMSIVGPALAGFLIAIPAIGTTATLYLISIVYLFPVAMLLRIRTDPPRPNRDPAGMAQEFATGVRYIAGHSVLRTIVITGVVAMVVGMPCESLMPVFASADELDVGASGLGLMSTALGVGALFGALGVANWGDARQQAFLQVATGVVFGIALAVFSLMQLFPLALLSLVLVGLASSAFITLNSTLAIGASEPAFYGRVSSVQQVNWSLSSLAVLPVGIAVDAAGAATVVFACGLVLAGFFVVLTAIVGRLAPAAPRVVGRDPATAESAPEERPVA
jgi:MFS family permease